MHFQRFLPLVALLALPGFVLLAWLSPALDYQFFCAGDNSCFREWVSALGGYFAIAAAGLTLAEMARQRRLQTEIQRENIELQIGTQIAIAKSVLSRVHLIKLLVPLIHKSGAWKLQQSDWLMDHQVESLFRVFKHIYETLRHPDFKEFERFGAGLYALETLTDGLARASTDLEDYKARAVDGETDVIALFKSAGANLAFNASLMTAQTEQYLADVEARAGAFVDKWQGRVVKED